jgi:LmbE family N-acetylglucosaminyl deacetylase
MKPVVGIFSHPDDEVFGPGGTLALFAKEGREAYIICVTDGDAGQNSSEKEGNLGRIRREELRESAKALGVKDVFFLGFKDGTLCNNIYHDVADKIQLLLEKLQPEIILTMENRGVSGHLDHIAVSMISAYVFEKMPSVKELWYYALTEAARAIQKPYFIYFPPGYKDADLSKTVDVSPVWQQKIEAMHQHKTQWHDIEGVLGQFLTLPKEEYFIIVKKATVNEE